MIPFRIIVCILALVKVYPISAQALKSISNYPNSYIIDVAKNSNACVLLFRSDEIGSPKLLVKLDTNLNSLVTKRMYGDIYAMSLLPDGSLMLAGYRGRQGYLIKCNANLDIIWMKRYYFSVQEEFANNAKFNKIARFDSTLYIVANFKDDLDTYWSAAVLATTFDGQVLWTYKYPPPNPEQGVSLKACRTLSNGDLFTMFSLYENNTRTTLCVRISQWGELRFQRKLVSGSSTAELNLYDIAELPNGSILLGGQDNTYVPDVPGYLNNIFIELDSLGETVQTKSYPSYQPELSQFFSHFIPTDSALFASFEPFNFYRLQPDSLRLDALHEVMSDFQYGPISQFTAPYSEVLHQGEAYWSFGYKWCGTENFFVINKRSSSFLNACEIPVTLPLLLDTIVPVTNDTILRFQPDSFIEDTYGTSTITPYPAAILVDMCNGCDTLGWIAPHSKFYFNCTPNPTTGLINLSFGKSVKGRIVVSNVMGQLLIKESIQGESRTLDLRPFSTGIYFVRFMDEDGRVGVEKVILE